MAKKKGERGYAEKFPPLGNAQAYGPHEYAKTDNKPKTPGFIRGSRSQPGSRGVRSSRGVSVIHSGANRAERRASEARQRNGFIDRDGKWWPGLRHKAKVAGKIAFINNRIIQRKVFAADRKRRIAVTRERNKK